jgi:hypothetical protein
METGPYYNEIAANAAANHLKSLGFRRVGVKSDPEKGGYYITYRLEQSISSRVEVDISQYETKTQQSEPKIMRRKEKKPWTKTEKEHRNT